MSDNTKIEWTDATVNAINGCSVTSPGCTNCYAMRLAGTRMKHHPSRAGLTVDSNAGPVWNGEVRFSEKALLQPLRWKRPRTIFWNAHGDMFHENVPDDWIDRCFAVMALTPHHRHQVLTKRSARMRAYLNDSRTPERVAVVMLDNYKIWGVPVLPTVLDALANRKTEDAPPIAAMPLPNVWLGVSVEDQRRADERIPDLLATPAAVRFLSCEPLLGPVDINCSSVDWMKYPAGNGIEAMPPEGKGRLLIDWVIAGGESGPGARPMHPDWARSIRNQCAAAFVPFHFKQWGEFRPYQADSDDFTPNDPTGEYGANDARHILNDGEQPGAENLVIRVGKRAAGRLLDGVTHDGMPA